MTGTGTDEAMSTSSEVEVPVSPAVAFAAFTDELDLWWVRGPINHFDGGRLREMRCEPEVGGRLLEVYDEAGDDVLELARVTAWEPGSRLALQSSLDDVATEVTFEPVGEGTRVRVVATVPAGGRDAGGSVWVRVLGKWFGPWCARREGASRGVRDIGRLALTVRYARPAAAARWLADVFGFEAPEPLPEGPDPLPHTDYGHPWLELRAGGASVVVEPLPEGVAAGPGDTADLPWVYVDDVEATHRRVRERGGAEAAGDLESPWGLPFFEARDPEGRRWRFVQARPTM
ncbi:SRPBCC domain-containing protein [Phycicoccus sonneratiae]|uniref:SRPBCC domain-containing protein n=1 Tax=Phycicoccus sonneratiae TaxID=2807628 RepID=A0ABS2CGK0_9MICO|nr:SRPBCC domain-containing protein [Phycicoccus sonneraticus]MBM6398905.1 SRPBCC domain-containing protein [Phycicoccus sonneraticus]